MTGFVAPARYPLTVLHRPDPTVPPLPAPEGDPRYGNDGRTLCGRVMARDELWMPVQARAGDALCERCTQVDVPGPESDALLEEIAP